VALPGLVGFVGEFLTLIGAFLAHRAYAVAGATGVIFGAVYLLWAYQRMWQGALTREENRAIGDLDGREWTIVVPLLAAIIALGVFPRPLLERIEPAARQVAQITAQAAGQRSGSALEAGSPNQSTP
jgi:NADH-quinone oxidoreductase subunit M